LTDKMAQAKEAIERANRALEAYKASERVIVRDGVRCKVLCRVWNDDLRLASIETYNAAVWAFDYVNDHNA